MALHLYYGPGACSFVPHALLEAAGADFEGHLVKLHKGEQFSPEFKAINPRSQVPVIVDGDAVITQIAAIVGYLDAKFPDAGILPADPLERARVMAVVAWINNTVHPTFGQMFKPQGAVGDDEAAQATLKAEAKKRYQGQLQELDDRAAKLPADGFFGGARFGAADAYALVAIRWGGMMGIDPEAYPALWALVQRVAAQPAVARVIERERVPLNQYKKAA